MFRPGADGEWILQWNNENCHGCTKITVDNTVDSDKNNNNSECDAMLSLLNKEEKAAAIKRLKNLMAKKIWVE